MQTVFVGKEDGKKRTVITQQYISGTYVAVYTERISIPFQFGTKRKEKDFHRRFRKMQPDFLKEESSIIPEETVVIFRKFKTGEKEIIAIFPEVQANDNQWDCQSYIHVGQHGPTSYKIVDWTTAATPEEYADLKAELESIGYDLVIRRRIHKRWYEVNQKGGGTE